MMAGSELNEFDDLDAGFEAIDAFNVGIRITVGLQVPEAE